MLILPIMMGVDYTAKTSYTVIVSTSKEISADEKVAMHYDAPTESQLKLKLAIQEAERRMIENDKTIEEYNRKYGITETRILPAGVKDQQIRAIQQNLIDKMIITPTEVIFP